MRPTTIGAGLDRRSQIAPTNFDLQHGPKTRPLGGIGVAPQPEGLPPWDVVSAGAFPRQSPSPIFFPERLRLRGARVLKWIKVAEMAFHRKNLCDVAFGQQIHWQGASTSSEVRRGATQSRAPGLSLIDLNPLPPLAAPPRTPGSSSCLPLGYDACPLRHSSCPVAESEWSRRLTTRLPNTRTSCSAETSTSIPDPAKGSAWT